MEILDSRISGSFLYKIKRLKSRYPLEIVQDKAGVTIFCPAFDEYGYGKTIDGAMDDLSSSLVNLFHSLKQREERLSATDVAVLEALRSEIQDN